MRIWKRSILRIRLRSTLSNIWPISTWSFASSTRAARVRCIGPAQQARPHCRRSPLLSTRTTPFTDRFPREFQPRLAHVGGAPPLDEVLKTEFDLYEQDFLTLKHADQIRRYTRMLLRAGGLDGHYERNTRQQITEVVMGDKYSVSGQAGAVGPQAHAHDMTFTQTWNQLESKVDLARLADELQRLRQAMEREASEPGHSWPPVPSPPPSKAPDRRTDRKSSNI